MSCQDFRIGGHGGLELAPRKKITLRHFKFLILCFTFAVFAATVAMADSDCVGTSSTCTFTLSNSGVSGGPFVDVTVKLNSTGNATITFSQAGSSNGIIDGSSLSLNVNTSLGYSGAFTGLTSNGETISNACDLCSQANNVSGFGTFNMIFNQKDASNAATTVSVTLTGGGWTSAAQVLGVYSKGVSAASHVAIAGCTFYVGDGTTNSPASCGSTSVPEPSVYLQLLASGLIALPFIRRKRII
jgi:Na+/glutamate symporter